MGAKGVPMERISEEQRVATVRKWAEWILTERNRPVKDEGSQRLRDQRIPRRLPARKVA